MALTVGVNVLAVAQSSVSLPTDDGFGVACIADSGHSVVDALPMDGSRGIVTMSLLGG